MGKSKMEIEEELKQEARLQSEWYMWFHNTYTELRGLLCYNLNNSANEIQGNINKAMGLQPGRSDMVLYLERTALHIEAKTPTGTQSKEQKEWQRKIEAQGFKYVIIRTMDQFQTAIQEFIQQQAAHRYNQ